MQTILTIPLAASVGFSWMNLVWVLIGATALWYFFAGARRRPAAKPAEPEPLSRPASVVPDAVPVSLDLAPEVVAAIAAAVKITLGASAYVTSVSLQPELAVSLENPMLTWSLEGRRQIYTSHKVR